MCDLAAEFVPDEDVAQGPSGMDVRGGRLSVVLRVLAHRTVVAGTGTHRRRVVHTIACRLPHTRAAGVATGGAPAGFLALGVVIAERVMVGVVAERAAGAGEFPFRGADAAAQTLSAAPP